jgi:hypothetical protein
MQHEPKALVPTAQSLLARRSNARRTVLLASAASIFLLSVALSSLAGLGIRGPLVATRATLAASTTVDSSVVITSATAPDARAQDEGVRHVIARTFAGVPVTVSRHRHAATRTKGASVSWTVTPDAHTIVPAQLDVLATGFAKIRASVIGSSSSRAPAATLSGDGPRTVSEIRLSISAVDTVLPIPITVLSLAGMIALLLCIRLLAATRENEARLLRARGGSVRTIVAADCLEMLPRAAIAAVAGGAVAQVILFFALGPPTSVLDVVVAPVAIIISALILSAGSGTIAARAAHGAPRPGTGKAEAAATLSVAGLLVIVSTIALWRFLQYGTPAVGRPEDASAVLAPALLLCTAAMLGLLLFVPITGWLQRRGGRETGFIGLLPLRTLHRNPRVFAGPIALVLISVATATLAAGYSATWVVFLSDSTRLVTGSDVRATFGGGQLDTDASSLLDSSRYSALPGVRAVAPVLRESATLGDQNVTAIGLSMNHAGAIVGPSSSVVDARSLVRLLRAPRNPLTGLALPAHASSLTLDATATATGGGSASALTTLWLADALGDVIPVSFPAQRVGDASAPAMPTPESAATPLGGPWRVVAADVEITASRNLIGFRYGISGLSARAPSGPTPITLPGLESWTAQNAVFGDGAITSAPAGGIGFGRPTIPAVTTVGVRLMPPGPTAVPVVVSRALADADALRIGDHFDVVGPWATFSARVVGVVPLVPGVTSQASLIGDLTSIDNGWLRSSEQLPALHELWMAGSPSARIAHEAAAAGNARITSASSSVSRQFVGGAVSGLWIGAAGSAAFAIVTLIASLASAVRQRGRELGVLRALGISAPDQARMRRREVVIVICFGLVLGLLTGTGMLALVTPTLARSSTPEAPAVLPLALGLDFFALALLIVLLLVGCAAVVGRYNAAIVKSALRAQP